MKKLVVTLYLLITALVVFPQVNTNRVMIIGKNAIYFEDYVVAIQYFNQVISAKPYLAEPYYFRAMAKFMLEDFKGAEEDADNCLERNPYYTAAYQLRGAARQNQDKFEMAAHDYQRSLEFFPEDRLTLINMAIVNMELKDYEIAEKFFDVLVKRYPDYVPAYLTRAQLYLETNDTIKAMADYNTAIEKDPYTSHSFAARGLLHFQLKDYNDALADLDEAIRLDPYYTGNYINRGLVKYNLNDLRGAMSDYDRVIETDKNNIIARFNRGLLRAQVADNNNAIEDFDKVIELEPENEMAYLNRAMLNAEIGDNISAINDLSYVLERHDDFFTGYYMRSELKRQLNDLRGAEDDYNIARREEAKAKQRATTDVAALKEDFEKSQNKETREETDKDLDKFNLLVVADKEAAEKEKSKYQSESRGRVQDMSVSINLEPKFVLTYYDRGFEINRPVYFSESLDNANHTLGLNWKLKAVNNEAGLNELQVKAHFRSIDNYSKMMVDRPNDAVLYFGRAIDFMLVQDFESALMDIDKAIELDANRSQSYFVKAVILTKQLELNPTQILGRDDSDEPAVVSTTTIDPLTGLPRQTKLKVPEVSTKSFRNDAVLKLYETVLKLDPDFIFAYYNMGEIFYNEKDYRAAIDAYTSAIKIEPQFAEAYFNRAIARLSIGDKKNGIDDMRKAGELGIVESYSIIKRMQ
ncbi:MAG: tetratricopeptide repeat protein [Proteiniphilum sp.]|nr:tetratricopeptide repeat protein [Proteiniphilum sp.]